MRLQITTAPAFEPVTLAEAKAHLNIDTSDFDTFLEAKIKAARVFFEEATGFYPCTQTHAALFDTLPASGVIEIEERPIASIVGAYTVAESGAETAWASSSYITDLTTVGARLALRTGNVWPTLARSIGGFKVAYTVGAETAPYDVKECVLSLVAHWFLHREAAFGGSATGQLSLTATPISARAILNQYRLMRL